MARLTLGLLGSMGASLVWVACGGASEPPAEAPSTPSTTQRAPDASKPGPSSDRSSAGRPKVMAEIGGLPAEGVQKTFLSAQDQLMACFQKGIRRVRFMGGDVKFWVKVDLDGRFMHAHLEHSDLGDRKTEQCLLDVLMNYKWPTPVGGRVGVATFSMGFDHAPDVAPPVPWGPERATDTLDEVDPQLDDCRMGLPGSFSGTVYVEHFETPSGADAGVEPVAVGRALAASATPPDEAAEMAVDCIVKVLLDAKWPDPGPKPAKIQFEL